MSTNKEARTCVDAEVQAVSLPPCDPCSRAGRQKPLRVIRRTRRITRLHVEELRWKVHCGDVNQRAGHGEPGGEHGSAPIAMRRQGRYIEAIHADNREERMVSAKQNSMHQPVDAALTATTRRTSGCHRPARAEHRGSTHRRGYLNGGPPYHRSRPMPTGRAILRPVKPRTQLSAVWPRTPADDDQPHRDLPSSETPSVPNSQAICDRRRRSTTQQPLTEARGRPSAAVDGIEGTWFRSPHPWSRRLIYTA
jgi:hypothetical protein